MKHSMSFKLMTGQMKSKNLPRDPKNDLVTPVVESKAKRGAHIIFVILLMDLVISLPLKVIGPSPTLLLLPRSAAEKASSSADIPQQPHKVVPQSSPLASAP